MIDFTNFDLLAFWRGQSITFPFLSRMALDVLRTLISTVASEPIFNYSSRVLEERRARLNEDMLEALMCVKDWDDVLRSPGNTEE